MKDDAGFTLIELMIAVSIAAVLMAISIPPVIQWRQTQQLNSATQQVLSVIQDMRSYAVKENANARIQFTENSTTYRTLKWKRADAGPVTLTHSLPPGIAISSTTFTSEALIFNSRGMSVGGNGTVSIQSSDGRNLDITVSPLGTPRIS